MKYPVCAAKVRTSRPRVRRTAIALLGASIAAGASLGGAGAAGAVSLNEPDMAFILEQIRRGEAHAAGGQLAGNGPNQISSPLLPYGVRTVDGSFNNIVPGQEQWGAADRLFPRLGAPFYRTAEQWDPDGPGGAPAQNTAYTQKSGVVADSRPRTISNLIVDQTTANPAAIAARDANPAATQAGDTIQLPNVATDSGLSAPYNAWFTFFGQFFDHGLDLTTKGGSGTVIVPLKDDDPLISGPNGISGDADDLPANRRFMVVTRARNQAGADGLLGTGDDVQEHTNTTTPYVDQNQTYTSHPSHQVFLREYELRGGRPFANGRLLDRAAGGGLAPWSDVKAQAQSMLGIALDDQDVLDAPLVLTDQYGKFIPHPSTGMAQIITQRSPLQLQSGTPANPVDATLAVRTGHAFLDDIAHHAAPFGDHDNNPSTPRQALTPDATAGVTDDGLPGTYDDEMLDAHVITGDGRGNENIGLTAVHHVFHAEHNLRVEELKTLILQPGGQSPADWQFANGAWNGERLFQAARFVTEMEYQHLVFEEFARKVQPQVNVFTGYESDIDPAITAEFAHVVYRFGHSMLNETIDREHQDGTRNDITLIDAFLNPQAFHDSGTATPYTSEEAAGSIVEGMTKQRGNEIDEFVTPALRSNLLGLPLDLATINIARGRDTGVPSLQSARKQFHATSNHPALEPYDSWQDFGFGIRHPESLVNFVAAYGLHPTVLSATTLAAKRTAADLLVNGGTGAPADRIAFLQSTGATWSNLANGSSRTGLDDVDFWIGGLAEKQMPFGGLLGSTFNYVFEAQMEKLQDGDRMYYLSRTAGLNFLTQLENNSFASLIQRTTNATHLPQDVFARQDFQFEIARVGNTGPILDDPQTVEDETTLLIREPDGTTRFTGAEHVLFGGTNDANRIKSSEGDDHFWGDGGNDTIESGSGNDIVDGGDGDDVLTDLFGDDNLKGGAGNDAISAGSGFDLILAGPGKDFVVAGDDPKETFAGTGDDFVIAGDSADFVFGDEGDDWIQGGPQADLLQGDHGDPFQTNRVGNDVLMGEGGNDDLDAEGGDDIMISGVGTERHEGMIGFDWVTYKGHAQRVDADMNFTGLQPPDEDAIRDRFDMVEGLSGWNGSDTLRGTDNGAVELTADHALTNPGLITGLAPLVGSGPFAEGDIILGGDGADIIEGRGGDDIIDGDQWLDAQISVRSATNPAVEIERVDNMRQVSARVFNRTINPSQLQIVRTIRTQAAGAHQDTAVFSEELANYTITQLGGGAVRVSHTGGSGIDGTDTLRRIERLQFADQTVSAAGGNPPVPGNSAPTGTVNISDTTPAENQLLTATRAFNDADGINLASIQFRWEVEGAFGIWVPAGNGAQFTPDDSHVGRRLRAIATYNDNLGTLETVTSAPTAAVTNVNEPATGEPLLSDTTPTLGSPITALTGSIGDADGMVNAAFSYQWQQGSRGGNTNFTDIPGAMADTFTPRPAQIGRRLRVIVRFVDDRGSAETTTSAASARTSAFNALQFFVPNSLLARSAAPQTISATVPEDVNVVEVRMFRAPAAGRRGRRAVGAQLFKTPEGGRYTLRMTSRKLRRLAPGRYEIQVRGGTSRRTLGGINRRVVTVVEASRRHRGGAR